MAYSVLVLLLFIDELCKNIWAMYLFLSRDYLVLFGRGITVPVVCVEV